MPTDPSARKPSLNDVARHAGVSGQTVSRVANGMTNVVDETRDRVLASMRELGYRPNKAARALRTGRFRSIGMWMPHLPSVGAQGTLAAVSRAAADAGFTVTIVPIDDSTQARADEAFAWLREQSVDGIIAVPEGYFDGTDVRLPPGLPVVVIDADPREDYPTVDSDQYGGGALATQHLLDLGHPTVWHVAGTERSSAARGRARGWRETLEAAGRPVPELLQSDWSTASGYELGRQLAARDDVTAVFAANDHMAFAIIRALREAGKRVPEDVSVVGFDDMEAAQSVWPPLTTIHQDFDGVGKAGVALILEELEQGVARPGTTVIPTRLVVRESTARYTGG